MVATGDPDPDVLNKKLVTFIIKYVIFLRGENHWSVSKPIQEIF